MTGRIVAGGIALALAGGIGWRVYQKVTAEEEGGPRRGRAAQVAVLLQPVRRETIRDVRAFTGTIEARARFDVAPKVPGRMETLRVNIGDEVHNGDLIATLDADEYARRVEQSRAELEVAKAGVTETQSALDTALRERDRVRELRKQKVASEAELDQAEAALAAAQAKREVALAQVRQREAALQADEVRLAYTRIAATWQGGGDTRVVGERFVDIGAMLRANDPIVSVLDIDTVVAAITVIERDYPSIRVGQRVDIATDAFPGRVFTGTIARKAPLLMETSRQARVEVEVTNADRMLTPGMFVRASIEFAAHEDATTVPAAALARRNGNTGVFLADTQALTVAYVSLTVGIVSGGRAEVVAPALAGQVVTLGQHLLEDGSAILLPDAAPRGSAGAGGDDRAAAGGPRP